MTVLLITAGALALIILLLSYICYRLAFYVKRVPQSNEIDIPDGEVYEPFREQMESWARETLATPCEDVWITSFDGLKLHGRYYEYEKGAPTELMFHGYRGTALRDLSGGVQRCFKLGRNALIVDQRSSGLSEGKVITFGVKEHRDCLAWVDFMVEHFGKDVKIILTGISMGGATVLMAAGKPLPENVIGVLSDCGYTSAKDIIKKVIRQMKLPPDIAYPFVRLGAFIFGRFDLEEFSPIEAVGKATLPVIFFHGDTDDFVPCEMSVQNYNACASQKRLVITKGAGHGLCYPVAPEQYLDELKNFFK